MREIDPVTICMIRRARELLAIAGPGTASEIHERLQAGGHWPPSVPSIRRYLRAARRADCAVGAR